MDSRYDGLQKIIDEALSAMAAEAGPGFLPEKANLAGRRASRPGRTAMQAGRQRRRSSRDTPASSMTSSARG